MTAVQQQRAEVYAKQCVTPFLAVASGLQIGRCLTLLKALAVARDCRPFALGIDFRPIATA